MGVEFDGRSEVGTITIIPGQPARIVLVGDFDAVNNEGASGAFAAVPAGDVILDLADVTFCCSAFLSCLLRLQQRTIAEGHRLEVSGMSPVMARLMALTGTAGRFPLITDR